MKKISICLRIYKKKLVKENFEVVGKGNGQIISRLCFPGETVINSTCCARPQKQFKMHSLFPSRVLLVPVKVADYGVSKFVCCDRRSFFISYRKNLKEETIGRIYRISLTFANINVMKDESCSKKLYKISTHVHIEIYSLTWFRP